MAPSSHPSGGHPKGGNGLEMSEAKCFMQYVYVLCSTIKQLIYVGCTDDLKKRYGQHQKGEVTSTKSHRPLKLIYYESYVSKTDALARKYKIKHHSQTRELLYKQLEYSINMASSSNG